jgi:hypothetical protein
MNNSCTFEKAAYRKTWSNPVSPAASVFVIALKQWPCGQQSIVSRRIWRVEIKGGFTMIQEVLATSAFWVVFFIAPYLICAALGKAKAKKANRAYHSFAAAHRAVRKEQMKSGELKEMALARRDWRRAEMARGR